MINLTKENYREFLEEHFDITEFRKWSMKTHDKTSKLKCLLFEIDNESDSLFTLRVHLNTIGIAVSKDFDIDEMPGHESFYTSKDFIDSLTLGDLINLLEEHMSDFEWEKP